jgi:hypothetical protein
MHRQRPDPRRVGNEGLRPDLVELSGGSSCGGPCRSRPR